MLEKLSQPLWSPDRVGSGISAIPSLEELRGAERPFSATATLSFGEGYIIFNKSFALGFRERQGSDAPEIGLVWDRNLPLRFVRDEILIPRDSDFLIHGFYKATSLTYKAAREFFLGKKYRVLMVPPTEDRLNVSIVAYSRDELQPPFSTVLQRRLEVGRFMNDTSGRNFPHSRNKGKRT
jgi:hypothetical protein